MPAAVKNKSKGTALLMEISSVYTAFPLIESIDISGQKGITFKSVTLDGPVHETNDHTGYVSAPTIKFDYFLDPAHTVHASYQTWVATPAARNFKVTYADSGPTSEIFNCTAGGVDKKVNTSDGLKASAELTTSGNPS